MIAAPPVLRGSIRRSSTAELEPTRPHGRNGRVAFDGLHRRRSVEAGAAGPDAAGCAELCGGTTARAVTAAAVMELVHASSLILDDLPCDGRRAAAARAEGQPPGIRRGDRHPRGVRSAESRIRDVVASLRARRRGAPVTALSDAVGGDGLIGGQATDLSPPTSKSASRRSSRFIGERRVRSSARPPRRGADRRRCAGQDVIRSLSAYAKNLGLPFRSSTTCSTSRAIRRRPARRRARTPRRRRSSRSAASTARASSRWNSVRPPTARSTPFGRRADRLRELSQFVAGRSW